MREIQGYLHEAILAIAHAELALVDFHGDSSTPDALIKQAARLLDKARDVLETAEEVRREQAVS